ncbi:RHS repeat-associated core domain-containing protein [Kribbella sandramycini]|uniref:RHS repeat-associated core domain-containing protein n=1 Tax=Kribbella sandramycini TaxID=60450 RepID=A0A7Y4KVV9_9ACTN|nr:RHS repeat-associated core domain-containing protein [Kribbella sandramycini]MBB6567807.1 RHS repeat-associated protein [Kribbella sandramycini]NOL39598.1 RHS repeat-associated core domain-containing protein [Kribbella sandramycini]
MRNPLRVVATGVVLVLVATLLEVQVTPVAFADGGPSVPLPQVPSTSVSEQTMGTRPTDSATAAELSGPQSDTEAPAGGGAHTATPLSPSATWEVAARTGDFTWSYPLRVPPSAGGLNPKLALSYASSGVDGRNSATNNQSSWVGEGWDLSPGFVERTYALCQDDKGDYTPPEGTGDRCWKSDNATASYNGGGGMLIRDSDTGTWRPKADDGAKVERLTGAVNGDDNGEYWKITTVDGTQYFYGSRGVAESTWTVPVFGDDTGEPCHDSTFASSSCTQAWRWNLDKVIDRNGNMILYTYEKETNSYGKNKQDDAVSYVRGGFLRRAEYGLRANDGGVQAGARVDFELDDRCIPGLADDECTFSKRGNWPDTPLRDRCVSSTCKDKHSPTFWTTKKLSKITTSVRRGAGYTPVDSWQLTQSFPDPGDGYKASLWLKSIEHTGHVGGTATLPAVTFEGTKFPNRVERMDGVGPLNRYRITAVVSEAGGVVAVTYAEPDCTASSLPYKPETNTKRCYPVSWNQDQHAERTDHFHKYVVGHVSTMDLKGTNPEQTTYYEYLGGAAWHYDTSEFVAADDKTWNEFRGYGRVRIRSGETDNPSGPPSLTELRFYRGMHGDRAGPDGGTKSESVADSENGIRVDHDWLAGQPVESTTYNGVGGATVSKQVSWPRYQGPTATRGSLKAYVVTTETQETYTTLAAGGRRVTKQVTEHDGYGLPVKVDDLGDLATAADDRCTRTTYERDAGQWLIDFPSRVETVGVRCSAAAAFPEDAISDVRNTRDLRGNITKIEQLKSRTQQAPVYFTAGTSTYDGLGRVLTSADAIGRVTKTEYTPSGAGPLTQTVVTNAKGHTVVTSHDPAWGATTKSVDANQRVTETELDPLGRTTSVWLPNRNRATESASQKYTYTISRTKLSTVTAGTLGPNDNRVTVTTLYDGHYRERQKQIPVPGGGRLLTDVRYDRLGRAYKKTAPYYNSSAVDDKLWVAADNQVASHTVTEFDGAGREIATVTFGFGVEKWRTTMRYGGDRVHQTPPPGGTATTTISDARGRPIERRTQNGTGYDSTFYTYAKAGQLETVKDPAGNVWRYGYDLRGHKIRVDDPDKGLVTKTFDDSGQVLTTTDARGSTHAFTYDPLGRQTAEYDGQVGGVKRSEWTYDTAYKGKGQIASSTRYLNGSAYVSRISNYDALGKPLTATVIIPEAEGKLAGSYTSSSIYNVDGSLASTIYPAAGDLPAETVSYGYDAAGRPLTTTGGLSGTTVPYVGETLYTRYGEVERILLGDPEVLGGRAWQSYYYTDDTRRVQRTIFDTEVYRPMQSDVRYDYDPAGNITSIADRTLDQPADVQCFQYDHLRRLTEAWTPGTDCAATPTVEGLAGPAPYWHSFGYDKVGNRTSEVQHAPAGNTTRTYTPVRPGSHQVASISQSGAPTDTFSYDEAGNTTTRTVAGKSQTLAWDTEGELAKVTSGTAVTEFAYWAGGGRMLRREPGTTTLYLGAQELSLNTKTGSLTSTRFYKHGKTTVASRTASGLTWLAADHQATLDLAVDRTTMKTTRRRQTPFGGTRGPTITFPGEKGFVGGTNDSSTGLTMIGARYYDPAQGRFLSVDPIMDASDPQQMHGYTYSNNNPVTYSDPTGMFFDDIWEGVTDIANAGAALATEALDGVREIGEGVVDVAVGAYKTVEGSVRGAAGWATGNDEAMNNGWSRAGDGLSQAWRGAGKIYEGGKKVAAFGSLVCPTCRVLGMLATGFSGTSAVENAVNGEWDKAGFDMLGVVTGVGGARTGTAASKASQNADDAYDRVMRFEDYYPIGSYSTPQIRQNIIDGHLETVRHFEAAALYKRWNWSFYGAGLYGSLVAGAHQKKRPSLGPLLYFDIGDHLLRNSGGGRVGGGVGGGGGGSRGSGGGGGSAGGDGCRVPSGPGRLGGRTC